MKTIDSDIETNNISTETIFCIILCVYRNNIFGELFKKLTEITLQ